MKSICKFDTKQEYEDYSNEVDMLGHVIEENKVYLRLGRLFTFCIHADFTIASDKNVQLIGNDCDLTKLAKIKITNKTTQESRVINPTKLVSFEAGDYKIDYGIYVDDNKETYTTPNYLFQNCPEVTYILVDTIVTRINKYMCSICNNLTGIMFGEEDQYPETQVFSEPYSHNDVIVNGHASFVDNSTNFLQRCPNIRNVYIDDDVANFTGCFGMNNSCMWGGNHYNNSDSVFTEVYLGKNVTTGVRFCNQNKITNYVISSENPNIEFDSTVHAIVGKTLRNGKKVIYTSIGRFPNNYLEVPSGYIFNSYDAYCGVKLDVINLYNYDTITTNGDGVSGIAFTGFRDVNVVTLILPRDCRYINRFAAGFGKIENLIIPSTVAPIVDWGGDYTAWYGTRESVYDYCFNLVTNCCGTLGSSVPKGSRNLYVLEGTQNEKDSWVEQYDRTNTTYWQNGDTGINERPNMWYDMTQVLYVDGDTIKWPVESRSPYREYVLNYQSTQDMNTLIASLIPQP